MSFIGDTLNVVTAYALTSYPLNARFFASCQANLMTGSQN